MDSGIVNRLGDLRQGRGIGATELAKRVGVSRQTIYAIESGTFVPNTEVALKLARALEVSVEDLFTLPRDAADKPKPLRTELLSSETLAEGQGVRVCRLEGRLVSVPVHPAPYFLPEAEGVLAGPLRRAGQADIIVHSEDELAGKRFVLAGCDPAISLLSRMVMQLSGVEVIPAPASSSLALKWLAAGKVQVAGLHLKDPETGEFNLPMVRKAFPNGDFVLVTFARWAEGWVIAPGNPKGIAKVEHLAKKGVRFINREKGSGSRALLDMQLALAGVPELKVQGYERMAQGHLAAAYSVATGETDCCVATISAARTFGLDFVPLQSERYDFAIRKSVIDTPGLQSFVDVLQRVGLRRRLELLAGYDTSETGKLVA
jgi:putative molybdopterin biosynthesis protein